MKLRQEPKGSLRKERALPVQDAIARATLSLVPAGLQVKWARLERAEQEELLALTEEATTDGGGLDLDRLDGKQLARWQALSEKAADRLGVFAQARELAEVAQLGREALRESHKPPRRVRYEQPGAVRFPPWIFSWLNRPNPSLSVPQLGLLYFVLAQLENGEALSPQSFIEGEGDDSVLVVNSTYGIGARFDPHGQLRRWRQDLDRLAACKLLTVERRGGPLLRIGRGENILNSLNWRRSA